LVVQSFILYRCNSKSKHITLVLFDLFRTGIFAITWSIEGIIGNPSLRAALCFLMWPPRAWPRENSSPQMEHSCIFGLFHKLRVLACSLSSSPSSFCLLWLALCPPSAWKEENLRLHVLHSNSTAPKPFCCALLLSIGQENSTRHFAKSKLSDPSLSLCLFIPNMLLLYPNGLAPKRIRKSSRCCVSRKNVLYEKYETRWEILKHACLVFIEGWNWRRVKITWRGHFKIQPKSNFQTRIK